MDQARAWGVPFAYVVADAGYGDNSAFLLGLDDRQVAYGERRSSRRSTAKYSCGSSKMSYCGSSRPMRFAHFRLRRL